MRFKCEGWDEKGNYTGEVDAPENYYELPSKDRYMSIYLNPVLNKAYTSEPPTQQS